MQKPYTYPRTNSDSRSLTVNDIMSYPVITSKEKTNVREIAKLMKKYKIGAVVVTNKINEPIGMITEGDIVRRLVSKKRNLWFAKAKHVMSNPIMTTMRHVKLEDAAKYMAEKKIKELCVIDDNNKLVGIITSADIMKNASYLIGVLKEIIHTGYVEGEEAVEQTGEL
jgi:CBS domain-containing protein